ncbi:Glutamate--cysteine ligase OS=Streptomyces alboniger OX=132473 GN=CP975_04910 PE=4 SV=1 [Streptomyces alboniger]
MGDKVAAGAFDLSDRDRYRSKLQKCLTGLERLLEEERFDRPQNLMGLEIELNLAGPDGLPRMLNAQVLERIASRDFQTELGMFNLEVNIAPHRLGGRVLDQLAEELRTGLNYAHRKANELDAGIVMIGILPTLGSADLTSANLSDVDRYALLNEQIGGRAR